MSLEEQKIRDMLRSLEMVTRIVTPKGTRMDKVFVVTSRAEQSGEMRAHVKAKDHREALDKFMTRYPGIRDMDTVFIAETQSAEIIL